ncbi:MAG: ketoacyl-ACP synthase III [Candidatus Eisenbacteria bacterium]|nr:ketoacyl-ACP synthase III [Candidatus Eisenbacteria bacterium]
MASSNYSVVVGTGSYIPPRRVLNNDFLQHQFCDSQGILLDRPNEEIVRKFEQITGITERRYATDDLVTSDIALYAAVDALGSSGIDKETLDYIILAHNFGDVRANNRRTDLVPSLAARVKQKLEIRNPKTVAYDLPFGCPGWLQGMIQSDYYLKSGDAKRILVIGAEILSRVSDPHDIDSMIYADGAGATILEATQSSEPVGILSHAARSDTHHAYLLYMGGSNKRDGGGNELFLKMHGHKLYEYALGTVPGVVKESLDKAGLSLSNVSKVLLHQANAKMDEAILKRLFRLYGEERVAHHIMPMTISWLGNSSVATMPTLLDLLLKGRIEDHGLARGDNVVFAAVGAGMNINSLVYRMP